MKTSTRLALGASSLALLMTSADIDAASHREAPITALDHKADITDFYAFVSYDDPEKVTFILNVDPLLEPANGPNYFPFDPALTYAIHIDNDHDARADLSFEFRFETELRLPGVFTGFVGAGSGVPAPANSPAPVAPGTLIVPPAITALEGPGSEGLGVRQTYSVSLVTGDGRRARRNLLADGLIAVPSNVGPRTMPDYAALADQGVHRLDAEVSVFAGTVEDPFWIDLGAAFDSLNFRPAASGVGVPGVLADSQDADDSSNFASDDVAGYNVNAIAIEVPISMLTADGRIHAADDPLATIGAWGTTSRPRLRLLSSIPGRPALSSGSTVQIQRMGNPLFNELLIGTGDKDRWSQSAPADDAQFADYALDPLLARVLNAVYDATVSNGVLPVPTPPRTDLLPLVQYMPPIAAPGTPPGPVADLLRLNTGIPATPAQQRSRLGFLTLLDEDPNNDDPAGFPNGRRLSDDVTDIAARVVAGVLAGPEFNRFPHNRIGDGVNSNDVPYRETFPYLGLAHSGRGSRHVDPGESGCTGSCPVD
ncbi:MAG: DUF4331 domain-containing protein [Gammaproteobacteria bacterium]|nr:DUF4331 domain-containing protein [Gammaproteobacteria bacterium]